MIALLPFRAADLDRFTWHTVQGDERAMAPDGWVRELERQGQSFTIMDEDGAVIGCAGYVAVDDMPPGVAVAAWAAFSTALPRHARPIVRISRARMLARPEPLIVTMVRADRPEAARFARAVGFGIETAAPDGRDLWTFRRDLPPCSWRPLLSANSSAGPPPPHWDLSGPA